MQSAVGGVMHMRRIALCRASVFLAVLWLPGMALASPETVHEVGLLPMIIADGVDAAMVKAIDERLRSAGKMFDNLKVLQARSLRKRMKVRPSRLISKCERTRRFVACIAEKVRRAGIRSALLVRVNLHEEATALQVLAIKPNGGVEPRGKFTLKTLDQVPEELDDLTLATLYGLPERSPAPRPQVAAVVVPPLPQSQSPPVADPGVPDTPVRRVEVLQASPTSVAPEPVATPAWLTKTVIPPAKHSSLMRWGGLSIFAVGVGGVGVGGYFLSQSNLHLRATRNNGSTTQVQAQKRLKRVNAEIANANIAFIAGTVLSAMGAGLFGLDWFGAD